MQDIQINLPTQLVELSFHDRAAIVARDILDQIGFSSEKLRQVEMISGAINMMPPFGMIKEAQKILKDIEPLLFAVQNNSDPGSYIRAIPQERIEYFLNLVITRLEWIKNGNEDSKKDNTNQENTSTETENTGIPEPSQS